MVRVLLADDQELVLEGLAALLGLERDIEVVAKVTRGDEVVPAARASGAQVCLLDIQMPGLDGIEVAARVHDELPGVRTVIVTTFDRPGYLRRALDAGVVGFVVKTTPARALAEAVRRAHQGLRTVDPNLASDLLFSGRNPLTPREQEVLRLAGSGEPIARLAARLHLSQGTVRNHLSSAIGKTGAANRVEAERLAAERGWL
ncbi:DNA-binding response regulator [Arachnia propionica]|uniref:DNA-binding response regulator n=1 Tax=Arachnia propionica TaxID=1750 RepID=A0A3P1T505_9ACTN|nr:response regulator transcription factor [Arachnia propionica]MDO5084197.1 response regulator transcription factor [Arachnia propionica]RRD03886.1 DNA-binding response regulator [Arachnia propionica]